jgi:cation diffusion facilitator CzcD-associated flavoprotein CzcO
VDERNSEQVGVAIIGAGFAGLGMAIRLEQAGVHDYVVFERADEVGGTWRENHYPGCCCDVPSHVYSYSFELNPKWTRGFAPQWEILAYLKVCAAKYGVRPHIRFGHAVSEAAWDDSARHWRVETSGGTFTADVLVNASGALSEPKDPDIPGLESFTGKSFHSATWDHDHDLTGERVAVIGTGASAIQFVPAIQPQVGRLHLFQRTPPWVIPRFDHQITRVEHALLRIPFAPALVRAVLYWLLETRVVGFRRPWMMKLADRAGRWQLKRQVPDPELREKLLPDYTMGCKRILISDNYYPSLTHPNVELVTDGIAEVRERSIVTSDGTEREVDTIIFGTGFSVTKQPIARHIRGRDGRTLAEHWETSMQAYLGTTVAGFPNFLVMTGPNTGLGHNSMVFMIESQLSYVLDCLRVLRECGAETFEVRPDVVERYNAELAKQMEGTVWTAGHCQSWYLDDTGRNTTLWPSFSYSFRRRTRRFDPESYELASGSPS